MPGLQGDGCNEEKWKRGKRGRLGWLDRQSSSFPFSFLPLFPITQPPPEDQLGWQTSFEQKVRKVTKKIARRTVSRFPLFPSFLVRVHGEAGSKEERNHGGTEYTEEAVE